MTPPASGVAEVEPRGMATVPDPAAGPLIAVCPLAPGLTPSDAVLLHQRAEEEVEAQRTAKAAFMRTFPDAPGAAAASQDSSDEPVPAPATVNPNLLALNTVPPSLITEPQTLHPGP